MEKMYSCSLPPGLRYAIEQTPRANGRRTSITKEMAQKIACDLAVDMPCILAAYAACGRVVILLEEGSRKRFRQAGAVACEASVSATVSFLRETYRVNPFGFFAGKVVDLTMVGEVYCLSLDMEADDIDAAVRDCFGDEMERVV